MCHFPLYFMHQRKIIQIIAKITICIRACSSSWLIVITIALWNKTADSGIFKRTTALFILINNSPATIPPAWLIDLTIRCTFEFPAQLIQWAILRSGHRNGKAKLPFFGCSVTCLCNIPNLPPRGSHWSTTHGLEFAKKPHYFESIEEVNGRKRRNWKMCHYQGKLAFSAASYQRNGRWEVNATQSVSLVCHPLFPKQLFRSVQLQSDLAFVSELMRDHEKLYSVGK